MENCYYCEGEGKLYDHTEERMSECMGCDGSGEMTDEEYAEVYANHEALSNQILEDEMWRGINGDGGWF